MQRSETKNFSQGETSLNNELSEVKCDDIKVSITIVVFTYTQYKGSLREKKEQTWLKCQLETSICLPVLKLSTQVRL